MAACESGLCGGSGLYGSGSNLSDWPTIVIRIAAEAAPTEAAPTEAAPTEAEYRGSVSVALWERLQPRYSAYEGAWKVFAELTLGGRFWPRVCENRVFVIANPRSGCGNLRPGSTDQ